MHTAMCGILVLFFCALICVFMGRNPTGGVAGVVSHTQVNTIAFMIYMWSHIAFPLTCTCTASTNPVIKTISLI